MADKLGKSSKASKLRKLRIKKGDEVLVIAGKDKGRKGSVTKIFRNGEKIRVLVDGVNSVKKHVKPNPQANEPGGIKTEERPIDVSNVMLLNVATDKGDRVGFRTLEDGTKVRYFKSTSEVVDFDNN